MHNYVKSVAFEHHVQDNPASYNKFKREISIDMDSCVSYYYDLVNIYNFYGDEELFYKYFMFIHILLHELEHAKQFKTGIEEAGIETSIIVSSDYFYHMLLGRINEENLKRYLDHQYDIYHRNWSYCPTERLAELNSNTICDECTNIIGSSLERVTYSFRLAVFHSLINPYETVDSPTKFYMDELGTGMYYPALEGQASELSWVDKKYGLYLSDEAKNSLMEQKEIIRARLQ